MPRPPRVNQEDAFYHVYNRGVARHAIVRDDHDRKMFIKLLGLTVLKCHLRLFAYCLMENHYHLFLQTPKANLDKAMWNLGKHYATYFNQKYTRVGPLFQSRYQAKIIDQDSYALSLIRYIHLNPVETAIVQAAEDYDWSSYQAYVGKMPQRKWLECDWTLKLFHPDLLIAKHIFHFFHLSVEVPGSLGGEKYLVPLGQK